MPYTISHDYKQDYLDITIDVKVIPELALQEALERWNKVFELAANHAVKRVHVLMTFAGTLDLTSKFRLTTSAESLGMSKKCRLAVSIPDEQSYLELLFTQTALNRLGYQMKIFKAKKKAIKWLAED